MAKKYVFLKLSLAGADVFETSFLNKNFRKYGIAF